MDLTGTYLPNPESVSFIRKEGYPSVSMTVQLKNDGTFLIESMPDMWLSDFGKGNGKFLSGSGRWEIDRLQDQWWGLSLEFAPVNSSMGKFSGKGFFTIVSLIGEHAPYTLHFTIGDPDQGEAIQFERSIPQPQGLETKPKQR